MPLLRTLIWRAARRLAADPKVREMAADAYAKARPKVEKMAADAYAKTRPKVDKAARDIRDAARETSPLDDPRGFAREVKDRISRKD